MKSKERILIQGAMEVEVKYFIDSLKEKSKHSISDFIFYTGTLNDTNVVISETKIGTINATIATMIALQNFNVKVVINQGLAGAHLENIDIGDLVIGEKCVNINCIRTPQKSKNEGIFPQEWKTSKTMKCTFNSDKTLLDIAKETRFQIKKYIGTLGSGDVFNKEYDRIVWTNNTFGSLCEDMESIAVYTTCYNFNIPCIGIRIISNNELIKKEYDESHAITCQKFVLNMLNDCKKYFLPNLITSEAQIIRQKRLDKISNKMDIEVKKIFDWILNLIDEDTQNDYFEKTEIFLWHNKKEIISHNSNKKYNLPDNFKTIYDKKLLFNYLKKTIEKEEGFKVYLDTNHSYYDSEGILLQIEIK